MRKTKEEMQKLAAPYFKEGFVDILATEDGHFFYNTPSDKVSFENHLRLNKVEGFLIEKSELKKTIKKKSDATE